MLSITERSARRSRRGFTHSWPLFGIAALTTLGCSIYGAPDGPESLETGGSSGSVGNDGGTSSSGGSEAAGGSSAASGSAGVAEGGSGDGSGGSELSAGGTETGSGGKGLGSGGSSGSDGGSNSGGSSAGTNSTGGTGGSGASDIVELALNRPAFGSSDQVAYTFAHGNDGNATTRWCSVERTFPQHWIVDLGESHELTSFEVTWESQYREMTYEVATSEDNQTYVVQVSRAQTGRLQSGPMMPGATGRFVRVWVTNAGGSAWPSFFEFKVFGK